MTEHINYTMQYRYIKMSGKNTISGTFFFSEGLAVVIDKETDNRGFIDETGKVVIPCQWRYANDFSEGLAPVQDEHKKWGYIDMTGKLVIPCQWKDVKLFREGTAWVKNERGEYFYINKTGKIVEKC